MQSIKIICVGKLKEAFYEQAVKEAGSRVYEQAVQMMQKGLSSSDALLLRSAKKMFVSISNYEDAMEMAQKCHGAESRLSSEKEARDARWRTLESRKYDILQDMEGLGLFAFARRSVLQKELDGIEFELSHL